MNDYLVSAIVSTYNSERFMRGLLEDLEAQTIADRLEIVIVDSNSPQNEAAVVKEFQQRYDNIVYVRTPMRETTHAAFTRCAKAARGKYLTLACTDDRHKRDALERMVAVLDVRPDIALVYANSHITTQENETFDCHTAAKDYRWIDFDPLQLLHGCFMGSQPMWRKSLHETYGYFDGSLESAGDWEFWLRLAERETFLHIDEFLGLYLYSETSSEHKHPERHQREAALVKKKYIHRESALRERAERAERRLPSGSGTLVLVVKGAGSDREPARCVQDIRRTAGRGEGLSLRVVKLSPDVPDNALGVNTSPKPATAVDALNDGAAWEAKYVALVSPDVILTRKWLKGLIAVAEADQAIAAVGPVSNAAPSPQRIEVGYSGLKKELQRFAAQIARQHKTSWDEVPYLGGFCLLLKSEAVRRAGGLANNLALPIALWDLYRHLREHGFKLACARGVYVHHAELGTEEGADYDDFAAAEPILEECLTQGHAAMAREDFETAAAEFGELSRVLPEIASGHAELGTALLALGRCEQAVASLRRAVAISSEDAELYSRLAVALYRLGRPDEAEAALTRALELDPDHLEAGLGLVALQRERCEYSRAAATLQQIAARYPNHPDVLSALAGLSIDMGGAEGARATLDHIRSVAPAHIRP